MDTAKRNEPRTVCKYVRSKESFHSETPLVEDPFHSGIYWCELTSDGMGPDGASADIEECCPGRSCFKR